MMQQKTERLRQIYSEFQSNLTQFAEKYKDRINHDSKFRDKFNNMCQELGVDPMICTGGVMQPRRTSSLTWASATITRHSP